MNPKAIVVMWVDWYAYHVARLRALEEHATLRGRVYGIEMVGGCGVHGGLNFRCEEREDLPVKTLLPTANWRSAVQWRISVELWRRLHELNPLLLLVPGYYNFPAITAALWGKLHGRRTVLMSESTRPDRRRLRCKEVLKRLLVRLLFDRAIAGGKRQMDYLQQLGFVRTKLARAYDVVDNDFYAEMASRARATVNPDAAGLPRDYFLFVGRLASEKNIDGLLRSFAEYRRTGGTWSLVLAGDGPLRGELHEHVFRVGLAQWVHFVGFKDSHDLAMLYAFARCFVLASVSEPWGLVVNEAMASGLPVVVSSRCGCVDDLVEHGGNGLIFDPGREDELTARMHAMAGLSEARLAQMGERSRQIIARYSLQEWASEVARIATT